MSILNNLKTMLRQIENDVISLESSDQKILNEYFTANKDKMIDTEIEVKDEDDEKQELPDGKDKIKDSSDSENDVDNEHNSESEEEYKEEEKISFTKDVLPFIVPLSCILTMNDKNKDFIDMLNTIKENEELLEVFNDQSYIWWSKTDIIEIVKKLVSKYIEKNSLTYNISVNFKMSLQSLIDKPKELLELIDSCLKPKQEEKKKFGEVFTPMKLVNEMLDKLDEYYKKEYGKSIFEEKDLKWFDPANGMGNFPIAVYLRLMEGLKKQIKDEKERKKHILENMLYMSELNKKNVYVCRQIFDINNEYKLNLYNGDSLKLDTEKEWGIKKFDIIMSNPPYQDASGNKGKGHTLWTKFVEVFLKKINKKKYLLFIHPSLWRQAEHPLFELMKQKQILYLEIHNETDGQKTFRCSTRYDWYIIQNKSYNKKTNILGQDHKLYKINLSNWKFIPNYNFDEIEKIICDDNKVEIIESRSAYGHDKKWVSKNKNAEYKYPVVYSVNKQDKITSHYSNTNKNGHFGLSKVIFGSGATGYYIDKDGTYGLTQWAVGICDEVKNLKKIKQALESDKFKDVIKATSVSKAELNRKVLKYFKKDFYKEFI